MIQDITIEDLRKYLITKALIRSIEEEILMVRESSAAPDRNKGGRSSVREAADPTHSKAMRIIDLEAKSERYRAMIDEVDQFVTEIEDPLIQSIIRWHYITGKSWGQTSVILYGYYDKDLCRKMVTRWFKQKN